MIDKVLPYEIFLRLFFFLWAFIAMASWEILGPRRPLKTSKALRWYSNLGLLFLDTLALRFLFPLQAVGLAFIAQNKGWGVLNHLHLPNWIEIVLGIFVLDFAVYLQHATFHFIPLFWRLHRVHHTDLEFDVTTGVRFHPIEILFSMGIKMVTVILMGPSPMTVIMFEIILNATSMFNHGNVRFPEKVDRWVRLLVVTPEMHRVHHSVIIREYNSNFGFNLPWWDRLLGTYKAQPEKGHEAMVIGLAQFRKPEELNLSRLLVLPFKGDPL